MSPAILAAIRDGLLSVLALTCTALFTVLARGALAWLSAQTSRTHSQTDAALLDNAGFLAHRVVAGIEQQFSGASGPAKKAAALKAMEAACPWLPQDVASVLLESGVKAMNDMSDRLPPAKAPEPAPAPTAPAPVVLPAQLPEAPAAGVV